MKGLLIVTVLVLFFLLGFISNAAINYGVYTGQGLQKLSSTQAKEQPSPSDYIKENQIDVQGNKVILNIRGVSWSSFADTNSMDPLLDDNSNALEIVPVCEDLRAGDIVVYNSIIYDDYIVHRIQSINFDDGGIYFRLKGDNNPALDPEKVRCDQIKYQVIGVLY